jgi:hypothetical protein
MIHKIKGLFSIAIPALVMIGLIPFINNDYLLTFLYLLIIIATLLIKHDSKDFLALFFGFFAISFFEYIFVKTGVEAFNRHTLFDVMPLWLPVLWGYGFVAIKRSLMILNK